MKDKESVSTIAKVLSRNKSSISREIRRNTLNNFLGYLPDSANNLAQTRKAYPYPKIERINSLRTYVIDRLTMKWSPEMIAGRMKREKQETTVSHETIYQFIYGTCGKKLGLYKYLLKGRSKRCERYSRKVQSYGIPDRVSIHQRPSTIASNKEFGHLEGDLTFFKNNRSLNLSVLVEKQTRFLFLVKNESKSTNIVIGGIEKTIDCYAQNTFKSLTFDNGKEFTAHNRLKQKQIDTYFCDPGAPWQKGQVERSIAILHRFLSKKSDLQSITEHQLSYIQDLFNNLPRKCLKFMTPAEVFYSKLGCVALQT